MALIKCPDCGKEFSDLAAACPNCGRPSRPAAAPAAPAPAANKPKLGCASIGCLTIIVLAIIGSLASHGTPSAEEQAATKAQLAKQNEKSDAAATQASSESHDFALKYNVQETVKSVLKDPESADFRDVTVVHKGTWTTVCGEVNAKNGFGGYTGYTEFVGSIEGVMIRSDENASRFVKRWNSRCAR